MIILVESIKEEIPEITRIKKESYENDRDNYKVNWNGPSGYDSTVITSEQLKVNLCYSLYLEDLLIGFLELVKLKQKRYLLNTVVIDPIYSKKKYIEKSIKILVDLMYDVETWEVDIPLHSIKYLVMYRRLGFVKSYEFVYNNEIKAVRLVKEIKKV